MRNDITMSKILKKYNEATGTWEAISAPDVSVVQQFENGEKISDSNVVITNENYINDDPETQNTLDDALSTISDDISKLQRNVSWLAKHGTGGGSGGGGGFNVSYGIEVTYKKGQETLPLEKGQSIYVEGNSVVISFMITGGSPSDICTYSYNYGNTSVGPIEVEVDKEVTFTVNFEKAATVRITAKNPYNATISPFNFTVNKSSLSIRFDAATAGEYYDGGTNIFQMNMNSQKAIIPILTKNGLGAGSTVKYKLKWAETETGFTETTTTENEYRSSIVDLWALGVPKTPGFEYPITITATASIGNVETSTSSFNLFVKIINPFDLTLVLSVNGLADSSNPVDVEIGSNMNIALRAFAPNGVNSAYYAGIIERTNGQTVKIFGKYYSDEIRDEGAELFDNDTISIGSTKILTYGVSESLFNVDEVATLTVKAWGVNSSYATGATQMIKFKQMEGIFPRQYDKRWGYSETKDIMLASWNSSNANSSTPTKWTSEIHTYSPVMDQSVLNMDVVIDANLMNGNGYSGILTNPTRMRLQNNAYLKIDIPDDYHGEIDAMSTPFERTLQGYDGYVVSVTFTTDETPLFDRVAFLWGSNMVDGETLANGIKITNSTVYWAVSNSTVLDCNISSGEKHTVDFVYDHRENLAKIYINGILNTAKRVIGTLHAYNYEIYVGANNHNGTISKNCDMSLFDFSIYTNLLKDTQLVINSKNARLEDRSQETINEYGQWRIKNFLTVDEITNEPYSMFENEEFTLDYIKGNISLNSNIPTLALSFPNTSTDGLAGFTESYFYNAANSDATGITFLTEYSYYYDIDTKQSIEDVNWNVALQGTSTLKYRVKNLEIYTVGTINSDGDPVLFQPKENWFPEKQFTLKADIVDSAHANNTVIGAWVNDSSKCTILDKTPPMIQLERNRPKDIDVDGNQLRDEYDTPAVNKDVTIKHTTEGFPILLFISFAGKSNYTFAGIYSFNLGRYSYYNLGLKFLESFSRYKHEMNDTPCPRMITNYVETPTFGTIDVNNVYSYEFDNLGSDTDKEHPAFSQYGRADNGYTLLDSYGSFKYGDDNMTIRQSLSYLLEVVAKCPITYTQIYDGIKNHDLTSNGGIIHTYDTIDQDQTNYELLRTKLHLKNAAAYFVIANAFGMTDSIGKNMTLRTWDGVRWYTCFYDMDTALGLDNTGRESILTNSYIDYITYSFDDSITQGIKTRYHSDTVAVNQEGVEVPYDPQDSTQKVIYTPGYAAYKSKLWAVLRDTDFLYRCGDTSQEFQDRVFSAPYINLWGTLRNGPLSRADKFSDLVRDRVAKCGEVIYDKDYESKYIRDEGTDTTLFLHGTRVEYIKKWLREHMYFLDGVFDINNVSNKRVDGIEDSPYYLDNFSFKGNNKTASNQFNLSISTTIPGFFTIGIDAATTKYYAEEGGKTYVFRVNAATNASTQIHIKGASIIRTIDGLSPIFEGCSSESSEDSLRSLMRFISTSSKFQTDTFTGFKNYLDVDSGGQLEQINISNSQFAASNEILDLGGLTKVLRIDVSRTNLGTLNLPDSSLDYLNVVNSSIGTLILDGQNKIETISTEGCTKLTDFEVINCEKMLGVNASDKENLMKLVVSRNAVVSAVTVSNCPSITAITINSNPMLEEVTITNCGNLLNLDIYGNRNLKRIILRKCEAETLSISIKDCEPTSIEFEDVTCGKPITFPEKSKMSGLTKLTFKNCWKFSGIKYDGSSVETYDESNVLDISPMTSLVGRNLKLYNLTVKYIRVKNDPENPFKLYEDTFEKCGSIVKVFGHIELNDRTFAGFHDFYINHDENFNPTTYPDWVTIDIFDQGGGIIEEAFSESVYNYDGIYPPFVTTEQDPYYTNITIGAGVSNLDSWFSNTNCDIHDAYYILQLCNDAIKSLNGTFNGCGNLIVTEDEWLDINMFAKCREVESIDNLFHGCRINCVIVQKPFEPLILKLKKFNEVFTGDYSLLAVGECFFPAGNKITEITGFNPQIFHQGSNGSYFKDETLLNTLTELKNLKNSFNYCSIDFSSGIYDSTDLFKYNVSLEKIENSFRRISGTGSLRNIFGGNSADDPDHFPTNLTTVSNSFTFSDGGHDGELYDGDWGDKLLMPIGNSLFAHCPHIKYVTGSYPGDNRTNYDYSARDEETDSFCGDGLLKYLDNIPYEVPDAGYSVPSDCDPDGFPHHIFDGLVDLIEIPALFANVKNFKDYSNGAPDLVTNITSYNGVSIFKDCVNLKNISKLFKDLDPSIVCTLSGKAFKNCQIVNAESAFQGIHLSGGIPFGMFYQSVNRTWDNGEEYEDENPTIENMMGVFREIGTYSGLAPYSVTDYRDLVMDNPDFSASAPAGTKNAHKKIWNLYAYDGTSSDFEQLMQQAINEYGANLYTGENPFADYIQFARQKWDGVDYRDEYFKNYVGYTFQSDTYAEKFSKSNYFCPPDIFKYCVNSAETSVARTFDHASGEYSNNGKITGLYGRIPEMIFYPLSQLTNLNEIFVRCGSLFPYYWGQLKNSVETLGSLYPDSLFEGTSVQSISGMFAQTRIWPKSTVSVNLFTPIASTLKNVASLWDGAIWVEKYAANAEPQLPLNLFASCQFISNVSSMLANSQANSVAIIQPLFTKQNNNRIVDCSGFLKLASVTRGDVPAFWEFDNLPPNGNGGALAAYYGVNSDYIYNYVDIMAQGDPEMNPYIRQY